jgi:hypothetical protein
MLFLALDTVFEERKEATVEGDVIHTANLVIQDLEAAVLAVQRP